MVIILLGLILAVLILMIISRSIRNTSSDIREIAQKSGDWWRKATPAQRNNTKRFFGGLLFLLGIVAIILFFLLRR